MNFILFVILLFTSAVYSAECENSLFQSEPNPYAQIIKYAKQRPFSPGFLMAAHAFEQESARDPSLMISIVQNFIKSKGEFPLILTKDGDKFLPGASRAHFKSHESFDNLVELIKNIANTSTILALRTKEEIDSLIQKRIYFGYSKSAESVEILAYSLIFLAERYPEIEQSLYGINHIANYYFNKKLENWYPYYLPYTQLSVQYDQESANDARFIYKNRGMSERAKSVGPLNAIDFAILAAVYDLYLMGAARYAQDLKLVDGGLNCPFDPETELVLRQIKVDRIEVINVLRNLQYVYALEVFGFIARAQVLSHNQYLQFVRHLLIADREEEFVTSLLDVPGLETFIETNDAKAEFKMSQDPKYRQALKQIVQSFWVKIKDLPVDLSIQDLQWLEELAAPRFK